MMLPDAQSPAGGPGQTRLPQRLSPMLATPGVLPGDGAGWALEMNWDGIRALAFDEDGRLRLASRTGRDITAAFPDLVGSARPSTRAERSGWCARAWSRRSPSPE